jgi:hypothetical protein
MILKGGLRVEAIYYFSLLTVFAVFFFSNILFLTLITALALAHFGAFSAVLSKTADVRLEKLTKRNAAWLLLFDVAEILVLTALAVEFYRPSQDLLWLRRPS